MIDLIKVGNSDGCFTVRTQGLRDVGHWEVSIDVDGSLVEESTQFLNYVCDYILGSEKQLKSGETMAYGYWLVQFQKAQQEEYLETWEYRADASTFVKGGQLTLGYWRDQHCVCDLYKAPFSPPRPNRLTVLSAGVMEGLPAQGVRYLSPDNMSGWWITSDSYDGNMKSLRREHTYHLTAARPDLAKYLALPDGFRFNFSVAQEVWFDEKVLQRG